MLAILDRYKIFLIILAVIALIVLLWMFISAQSGNKTPSRGVFVILRMIGSAQGGDA